MGEEGGSGIVDRVADALARLGGDPRGARRTGADLNEAPLFGSSTPQRSAASTDPASTQTADSRSGGPSDSPSGEPVDTSATPSTDPRSARSPARPVTDGGADGVPPGESPWADDDPIVFGDDVSSEHGTSLLDAVTEPDAEEAPPFGSDDTDATQSGGTAPSTDEESLQEPAGIDPERLDELEARLDALESDHLQLESSITDVTRALTDVREEVTTVGTDVQSLVAMLGGIALAREAGDDAGETDRANTNALDDGDLAELAAALDELTGDAAATSTSGTLDAPSTSGTEEPTSTTGSDDATSTTGSDDASTKTGSDDASSTTGTGPDSSPPGTDDTSSTSRSEPTESSTGAPANDATDEDSSFDAQALPDGIHRGAGEPPATSSATASAAADPPDEAGGTVRTAEATAAHDAIDAGASDSGASPDGTADSSNPAAPSESTTAPARELVDPRTDAVGARLRQFREGFVDDPTADLPTGNAADEFRFEKILLPTDGDAAPDLSNAELAKPYLETLPDGYAVDAVVLEWLDWLVSAADGPTAAQAIRYYESIEWLTEDVRDSLLGYLEGLGEPAPGEEQAQPGTPPAALDLQDHLRSLQYVTELASGEVGSNGV